MKKVIVKIVLALLVVGLFMALSLSQPWKYLFESSLFNNGAALTVNSPGGKADVYLDGKKIGETPYSSANLKSGEYQIELRRETESSDFYQSIGRKINLEPDTRAFIEAEIGPTEEFSSLKVAYYQKSQNSKPTILLDITPKDADLWIDGEKTSISDSNIVTLSEGEHTVKVEQTGYEPLDVEVISRSGYTLIVEVKLMTKPIDLLKNE
ncbi:PEGA domain-containing protein [Candidatus Dojkabacteria bacterium]|nr:PEGA domain-containing protein [Candidatus Dojkabacteria bacterium]